MNSCDKIDTCKSLKVSLAHCYFKEHKKNFPSALTYPDFSGASNNVWYLIGNYNSHFSVVKLKKETIKIEKKLGNIWSDCWKFYCPMLHYYQIFAESKSSDFFIHNVEDDIHCMQSLFGSISLQINRYSTDSRMIWHCRQNLFTLAHFSLN